MKKVFFHNSKITFLAALGYIILIILFAVVIILVSLNSEKQNITNKQNKLASQKMQLASQLAEIARTRARLTGKMIYLEDYFEKDEIRLQLDSQASRFSTIRSQLLQLPLDETELALLEQQASIVPITLPLQRKAADLAMEDDPVSIKEAQRLLYEVVFPGQEETIAYLLQFRDKQKQQIDRSATISSEAHQDLIQFNTFIFIFVSLVAIVFATIIIIKIRNTETALLESKKQTQVALEDLKLYENSFEYSGEAMVITDKENRILNVNSAFTVLTGYSLKDLMGKDPNALASGKTPVDTYENMWNALKQESFWQGELWDRKKNGEIYAKWISISVLRGVNGEVQNYIASFTDITDRKNTEERIEHLAHHDILTGLYNRFSLGERLGQSILSAKRARKKLALIFIDLDKFKNVNDTLGHSIGDKLLIDVAKRIKSAIRESDIAARNGGDEFVVVINDIGQTKFIGRIAEKILNLIARPYHVDNQVLEITPSMGISVYPHDGKDSDTLLKNADIAMYHAKEHGRNNFQLFSEEMLVQIQERLSIEHELSAALQNGQMELYYQPQIDADNNYISAVEALVRWRHPERGIISPEYFITIAEESGLIHSLGSWVLNEACGQLSDWKNSGVNPLRIAVNLSTLQLQSDELVDMVRSTMHKHHISDGELELEVTESSAMEDPQLAVAQLNALRELGVSLAIDDFGTGYSSLAYIKRLPVQILKLDKTFVQDIGIDEGDTEISAATLALAHNLKLKVVAEGVETEFQRNFLIANDCDYLQGYLFSKPLPASEITEILMNQRFYTFDTDVNLSNKTDVI
ncbi:MAG: EAL domain-containing protein [Gammaproteobacteria bacterium]|nr:EAL domain-containing protein [Gammaproteobacteria bacterium]